MNERTQFMDVRSHMGNGYIWNPQPYYMLLWGVYVGVLVLYVYIYMFLQRLGWRNGVSTDMRAESSTPRPTNERWAYICIHIVQQQQQHQSIDGSFFVWVINQLLMMFHHNTSSCMLRRRARHYSDTQREHRATHMCGGDHVFPHIHLTTLFANVSAKEKLVMRAPSRRKSIIYICAFYAMWWPWWCFWKHINSVIYGLLVFAMCSFFGGLVDVEAKMTPPNKKR